MWTFLVIYVLSLIAFGVHLYTLPPVERTKARIIELLLLYQLVFSVGITSFLAFIGLNFLGNAVTNYTGWPKCPFMQELANVNLAFGVLGIMAIWLRNSFWIAIVVGFTIWIFGDAIHHFYDAYIYRRYTPGNLGLLVYTDLVVPIVLCILLALYLKTHRSAIYH